jgi:hypothetical protein
MLTPAVPGFSSMAVGGRSQAGKYQAGLPLSTGKGFSGSDFLSFR